MMPERRRSLSSYMRLLLAQGRIAFTRTEAQREIGIGAGAFLDAAERQQRYKHLLSPRRGFYVIVPPQFQSLGAPPPSWYVDSLMRHEGRPYYVALLKAAELHGATHQAVMEFQVMTDKRLPRLRAGRSSIAFYYRKDMEAVALGLAEHKTDTGKMTIATAELTALDMLRYPHASGGIDHILTVLTDLGPRLDATKLATLALSFERSIVQRLGYLLGLAGHGAAAESLYSALLPRGPLPWVELEPAPRHRELRGQAPAHDPRWRVVVRRVPEADE